MNRSHIAMYLASTSVMLGVATLIQWVFLLLMPVPGLSMVPLPWMVVLPVVAGLVIFKFTIRWGAHEIQSHRLTLSNCIVQHLPGIGQVFIHARAQPVGLKHVWPFMLLPPVFTGLMSMGIIPLWPLSPLTVCHVLIIGFSSLRAYRYQTGIESIRRRIRSGRMLPSGEECITMEDKPFLQSVQNDGNLVIINPDTPETRRELLALQREQLGLPKLPARKSPHGKSFRV